MTLKTDFVKIVKTSVVVVATCKSQRSRKDRSILDDVKCRRFEINDELARVGPAQKFDWCNKSRPGIGARGRDTKVSGCPWVQNCALVRCAIIVDAIERPTNPLSVNLITVSLLLQ